MTNYIVVHIGLPRTASTSLQIMLDEGTKYSETPPIFYPLFARDSSKSIYGHNHAISKSAVDEHGRFIDPSISQDLFAEIKYFLEKGNVIISAEDFWRCNPKEIGAQFEENGLLDRAFVIYSIRSFPGYIASLYKHNHERIAESFLSFLESTLNEIVHLRTDGHHLSIYDYTNIFRWEQHFPRCARLEFPPINSPLIKLGNAIGLENIPCEWHNFCVHANRKEGPKSKTKNVGTYNKQEKIDMLSRKICELGLDAFADSGVTGLNSEILNLDLDL